ncbi:MAG: EamA family transporter [Sulfurospirillaceae bacterium]|nr:EamA family transporter [Sulfurospirillaceae bacterium]
MKEALLVQDKQKIVAVIMALLAVYIVWGSTYLGIKIAIETLPPFLMAGSRFLMAGLFLYGIAWMKVKKHPPLYLWKDTSIVGVLLLLGGNGLVVWAEQSIPSSIASLIIATVPLWIIIISKISRSEHQANKGVVFGTLLGFLGVAILMLPFNTLNDVSSIHLDTAGMMAVIAAAILWSLGSVYSQRAKMPSLLILSTAMQMIAGGIALLVVSYMMQEWQQVAYENFSSRSLIAFVYLTLVGSLMGYTAYLWLLKNTTSFLASTYAFVNPVVAIFLGYIFADEVLTKPMILAALMIISAVIIITVFKSKKTS